MSKVRYHMRDDGQPGRCDAAPGNCPLDPEATHYDTPQEVRVAFEEKMAAEGYSKLIAPKRAKSRENFSVGYNSFRRAALDSIYSDTAYSLMESWRYIVKALDGKCYICDERIYDKRTGEELPSSDRNKKATADHIVSSSEGGAITPGNLAPAHFGCNNSRADTPIEIYLKDKPDTLKIIKEFQQKFGYKKPDLEEVKRINESIDAIYREAREKIEQLKQQSGPTERL